MKLKWEKKKACYEAWLPLDHLPPGWSFVYRANNNMAPMDPMPPAVGLSSYHEECQSQDVVIVGNSAEKDYILAGAVTAHRSLTYFQVHKEVRLSGILVRQPFIKPDETPEKIVILRGSDWRQLLLDYAKLAAEEMGVKPINAKKNLTGYCTWYYYYADVTEADFLENVEVLKQKVGSGYSPAVIQIDDGYQTFQGDWMDQDSSWPTPLPEIAKRITEAGITAGIWLMPFVASTASRRFREHPDWFVKNREGEPLVFSGWSPPPDHLWACLDATIPEVQEHMRNFVLHFYKMGFRYFKFDGLSFGLPDGIYSDPEATPVSAFRLALKTIREAVPDATILGCCPPFMACLGYTDMCRVSVDTARYWVWTDKNYPDNSDTFSCGIKGALQGTVSNWWKNDLWFRSDPDVIMARADQVTYTIGEARLSAAMGILTGVSLTSDHFGRITPERLKILECAAKYRLRNARPVDDAVYRWPYTFSGTVDGKKAALLINISEQEKTWNFADYGLPETCEEVLIGKGVVKNTITLSAHDAALIIAQ